MNTNLHESAVDVVNEALGILRQDKELTLAGLNGEDRSPLARKCARAWEPARLEVLLARNWNFCRRTVACPPVFDQNERMFRAAVPGGALKVESVYGEGNVPLDGWTVRADGTILSLEPIVCVGVVDASRNVDRWPAFVRRALVHCLARDLAIPVTGRQTDLKICQALYAESLETAALHDARENNSSRDAWGRNAYADAILGRGRHEHPFRRR